MSEEWGTWIEHDGNGCPCVGVVVHCIFDQGTPIESIGVATGHPMGWVNDLPKDMRLNGRIIRYRIRKPKGMQILNEIARSPERELEDA